MLGDVSAGKHQHRQFTVGEIEELVLRSINSNWNRTCCKSLEAGAKQEAKHGIDFVEQT
jgi:hypothetical protein